MKTKNEYEVMRELANSRNHEKLYGFCEVLADISGAIFAEFAEGKLRMPNSRDRVARAIEWATEFHDHHRKTDWSEVEYLDTVDEFIESKLNDYRINPRRPTTDDAPSITP